MNAARARAAAFCLAACLLVWPARVFTHAGPPFPIVSDRIAGAYQVSVWTDPDATDDGSQGGQFWVTIALADGSPVPPDTRARVTIKPLDQPGPEHSGETSPVNGDLSNQFVALVMDHEGPFAVRAMLSGSRGDAAVEATVDATYDLRPPPVMLVLYLLPFVMVAGLWLKLLVRRRRAGASTGQHE